MSIIALEVIMQKKLVKSTSSKSLFEKAREEYLSSIKKYSKEEILVFVLQRHHRALWKNSLSENFSTNISSYFSFVQKELSALLWKYPSSGIIWFPEVWQYLPYDIPGIRSLHATHSGDPALHKNGYSFWWCLPALPPVWSSYCYLLLSWQQI